MNAVISGGSKGIGREIARSFAKEGFHLALGARSSTDLEKAKKELLALNKNAEVIVLPCDFSKLDEVKSFADTVLRKWGHVDILVNNVGTYGEGSISEEDDGTLEHFIGTNLYSSYYLTRCFLQSMKKRRSGHIITICSVAAIEPRHEAAAYTISKYAQYGFSKVLSGEMKRYGVKVTSVLPGPTLTSSWDGTSYPKEKLIDPADIAAAILSAIKMSPRSAAEELFIGPMDKHL